MMTPDQMDGALSQSLCGPKSGAVPASNRIPDEVIFFPNGTAAVFDQFGQQMPQFQEGKHYRTIELLEEAGHDWRKLKRLGSPQSLPAKAASNG